MMMMLEPLQNTLQTVGRLAAGCVIGLLSPGALLLDAWMAGRTWLGGGDAPPPGLGERSAVIAAVLGLYWWVFGPLVMTAWRVAMVGSMPMFDIVEVRIVIGGPITTHIWNAGQYSLVMASLGLSLAFRTLHLAAVVTIRAPTSGLLALGLCMFGQRGLW